MKRIISDIKNKAFAPAYLIYGPERYLCRYYTNELINALGDVNDTMNTTVYSGKDTDVVALISMAQTLPFFAPRRVIVVKNSGFFKSANDKLADYLKNPSEDTVIVFCEEEVDKRSKTYKALSQTGYVSCMELLDEASLIKWSMKYFAQHGINTTSSCMHTLISRVGTDMDMIRNESEKLVSFLGDRKELTQNDIMSITVKTVSAQIFDMTDAIANKDAAKALDIYADLISLKESPLGILYMISRMFRQLYEVKTYSGDDMAGKLSLHPFVAKKYMQIARNFTAKTLLEAATYGAELEYDVKVGKLDEKISVEMFIIKYAGKN